MGGLLSRPRAADKLSTAPPQLEKHKPKVNARNLTAPFLVISLSALFYFYARTSIKAAKLNAQRHREADGGQISWHRESQRRHGQRHAVNGGGGSFRDALLDDLGARKKTQTLDGGENGVEEEQGAGDGRARAMHNEENGVDASVVVRTGGSVEDKALRNYLKKKGPPKS